MQRYQLMVTTDEDGAGSATQKPSSPVSVLYRVEWIDGDLATGVDAVLSVTDTLSGVDTTLLTLTDANDDAVYYPVLAECDNTGQATGTYRLPVVDGSLKLSVTGGGSGKSGGVVVYLMDV